MGNPLVRRISNAALDLKLAAGAAFINYTSGFMVLANVTYQTMLPNNKVKDEVNAFNTATGEYTVQPNMAGDYEVDASFYCGNSTGTTTDIQIIVQRNGVDFVGVNKSKSGTAGVAIAQSGAMSIPNCVPGDVLRVRIYQGTGGPVTMISSSTFNWVSVRRVKAA